MYEEFYGFSARPFQLTPDPQFWFESVTHKKAMSYLGYGLGQGEGFIVITGEVGAGKSTLVAHLMERIDPEALTVAQVVTSSLDGEEIVHVVAQAFGLAVEGHDKAAALGAIERFLQDEARAGRRCLLVVDECQNLALEALEELRMLSNFQLGSHPLLQSLLLGQPEFRRTLAHHPGLDQLRQRIIASHHLAPLGEDEIEAYVTHRLMQVGWDARPALGEGLVEKLYIASEGIPRRVNRLMNRLLLLGAIEEEEALTPAMLEAVVEEMAGDEAEGSQAEAPKPARSHAQPAEPQEAGSVPPEEVAALLAQRDARTAELEAAILELQAAGASTGGDDAPRALDPEIAETIRKLEARLEEQEQSLRHVLTMLIEWFEDDAAREAA
ncbi:XrtA/PEP-CTERM system-associated ATPase [Erythrobacter sp.]|uniref:XrtA/PEP-CTERM system-associated ATPase n=1 Tax=Erythrobacter sp. TaxID=1042 RepID=UPI001425F374|nr:XrtA/PEP-CTERM system-associated ATPase [Erythrobacter sp.]QIQ85958.1 MAG: AAA family ATPase [Erythrobacter sp.]